MEKYYDFLVVGCYVFGVVYDQWCGEQVYFLEWDVCVYLVCVGEWFVVIGVCFVGLQYWLWQIWDVILFVGWDLVMLMDEGWNIQVIGKIGVKVLVWIEN